MQYRYKGLDSEGKIVRGTIEASDMKAARHHVKSSQKAEVILDIQKMTGIKPLNNFMEKRLESLAESENLKKEKKLLKEIKKKSKPKKEGFLNQPLPSLREIKLPSLGKKKKETILKDEDEMSEVEVKKIQQIFSSMMRMEKEEEVSFQEQVIDYERRLTLEDRAKSKLIEKKGEKEIDWALIDSVEGNQIKSKTKRKGKKLKIKTEEMFLFTRRLQIMLSSGISLLNALMKIKDNSSPNMSIVVGEIIERIMQGTSFSEALTYFPKQFNHLYVALVSIGEKAGSLDKCLLDVLAIQEQQMEVRKKIKSATIYPIIIGIVLIAALFLGSIYFIPSFEGMFADQGMDLPILTKAVFAIADLMPLIMGLSALFIMLFFFAVKRFMMVERFWKKLWHKFLLKAPIIKKVSNSNYMFTFSSSIALMLGNGIRLKDSLELTYRAISNVYLKNAIIDASGLMVRGDSFSESLNKQKEFDNILIQLVETGEDSGNMREVLDQAAKFFKDDLNRQIAMLLEMVQPVAMLLVGLIAGPVIIAVYLPILDMSGGALGI